MWRERLSRLQSVTLLVLGDDIFTLSRGYAYRDMICQKVFERYCGWGPRTSLKHGQDARFTAAFSRSLKNMEQKGLIERRQETLFFKDEDTGNFVGCWTPRTLTLTREGLAVLSQSFDKPKAGAPLESTTTMDRQTINDKVAHEVGIKGRDFAALRAVGNMGEAGNAEAAAILEHINVGITAISAARMVMGEKA